MRGIGFTVDCSDAVAAGSDEAGFSFVAFPSRSLAWRFNLSGYGSRALLRAADGSLWLLGTPHLAAFTLAHLAAANARICRRPATGCADIAADLSSEFQDFSVSVSAPRTLDARELWDIDRFGDVLLDETARRCGQRPSRSEAAPSLQLLRQRLHAALTAAVSDFVAKLDSEIVHLASQRQFDARIYNWLLGGAVERRRQFARAFPLFLPFALAGHRQAAELHRIVDRGHKLAERLALLWSVRPGVIRALRQPAGPVAAMWLHDPKGLAATFDALPAETWPRDAAAWRRFDRLVNCAVRGLTTLPSESTVALAWLRAALTGRPRTRGALGRGERLREGVVRVAQMRDTLVELLAETLRPQRSSKAAVTKVAAAVVDGFLLKLSAAQQVALAERYREELARSVGADVLADQIGLLRGARGWPLFPADYVSPDRSRRVTAVCSRQELRRCGAIFGNCLRGSHFDGYASRLVAGSAFYVALFDARTARPCSLAELAVDDRGSALIRLSVAQHQAPGNVEAPSPECRAALAGLLRFTRTAPIQSHLRKGLLAMRGRAASTRTGSRVIGRSALAQSLWKVIGSPGMAAIIQRITTAVRGRHENSAGAGGRSTQLALPL